MPRRLAPSLALLAVACAESPAGDDAGAPVDATTPPPARSWLRDDTGGVLVLRGTNVQGASKWSPDRLPPHYASVDDFARLSNELGMNAVRFLIFWEAVEPSPGVYDDAYLAAVRRRVEAAGAAGLHVIVDMHQDVFGVGFGGDGAPRWACDEALYESFTPPEEWFLGYFEPEVAECFDRLWLDPDLRAAYGAMWARVAEALRGAEGLLAYELINEPFWGTTSLRAFEREVAPAAYAEWIDRIREVDPDPYVMIGPSSAANVGLSSSLAPPDRARLVYGPHLYPPSLERGTGWTGTEATIDDFATTITEDAARMGLPAVVGEIGGRRDVPGVVAFLEQAYAALDRAQLGATQWDGDQGSDASYGLFHEDGTASAIAVALARPHPARVAGRPLEWSWDPAAGRFELSWEEDAGAAGDTRVTLPSLAFAVTPEVALDDGGEARVEGATLVVPSHGGRRHLVVRRR